MSVREARISDAPRVAELLTQLGSEGVDAPEAERRLRRGTHTVFVVEREGEVAGLVALRTDTPFGHARQLAHISALVTLESARRSGVGQELVEAAIDYARRNGCTGIELTCGLTPAREAAHRLYQAAGFEKNSIRYWLPVESRQP
jgi:ribosomal protein S18 acetylase RimI-like enzyme